MQADDGGVPTEQWIWNEGLRELKRQCEASRSDTGEGTQLAANRDNDLMVEEDMIVKPDEERQVWKEMSAMGRTVAASYTGRVLPYRGVK